MGLRSDYKVMSRKPWSCIWCSFRMTSGLSVSFCSNPCLSHSFNMFQLCYSILQLMSLEVVRSHFTSSVADSVHAVIRSPSSYDSYELWNTVEYLEIPKVRRQASKKSKLGDADGISHCKKNHWSPSCWASNFLSKTSWMARRAAWKSTIWDGRDGMYRYDWVSRLAASQL